VNNLNLKKVLLSPDYKGKKVEKSFPALAVVMNEFSFLQISLLGFHNINFHRQGSRIRT